MSWNEWPTNVWIEMLVTGIAIAFLIYTFQKDLR